MDIKGFYFSIVPTTKKSETRYQDIQCLMSPLPMLHKWYPVIPR